MNTLLTIRDQDVAPDRPTTDMSRFTTREAARAVLMDDENQIYLLHVSLHGYHKLPGGGIDEGEEVKQALERELMEEVGCRAEIIAEIGTVVEYRSYEDEGLKQTSYCYLAKQIGEQLESALEEGELAEGMFEVKARSIEAAIELLKNDRPDNFEGRFIQRRDLAFLEAARSLINRSMDRNGRIDSKA